MRCGKARNRTAVGHRHDRQAVATLAHAGRTVRASKRLEGLAERRRGAERKPGILQHHFEADPAERVEQRRDGSVAWQTTKHARELGFHRVAAGGSL